MIYFILPALLSAVLCAPTWDKPVSEGNRWNGPSQKWQTVVNAWPQDVQIKPAQPQDTKSEPWQQQPSQNQWQQTAQPVQPAQKPWQPKAQPPQPAQKPWHQGPPPQGNQWQPQSNGNGQDNDIWPVSPDTCQGGQFRPVDSDPNQFEMCVNGRFIRKSCAPGTTFQPSTMSCAANNDNGQGNGNGNAYQNTEPQSYNGAGQPSDQGSNPWQQKQQQPAPTQQQNPWQQKQPSPVPAPASQWQQPGPSPQQPVPWQQKPAPQTPAVWQQPQPNTGPQQPNTWQQMPQNPSPPQQPNPWQNGQPAQPAPWMQWQNPGNMQNSWNQPMMPAPNGWNVKPTPMPWQPAPTPAPPGPTPMPATPAPATPSPTTPEPTTTTTATTTATTTTSAATTTPDPTTPSMPIDPWVHAFPDKCKSGSRRSVQGNNDAFEVCDNGEWVFMLCAPGTWFDTEVMDCSDGFGPAPAWPVTKDMMPSMNGQMQNMNQNGGSPSTDDMMMMMNMMNMMPDNNNNGQNNNNKMQTIYTNHYGNVDMMQQKMPNINGGMEMMQPMQMNGGDTSDMVDTSDMADTDDTQTDNGDTMQDNTDPNLWLHDVREVIIVSVEKCKVGRTREDESASKYQECIMNPAGVTMWIRRKCAPGTHFSPWTRNCGKVTFRFNGTYPPHGGKQDVVGMKPDDMGQMPDEMMMPDNMMPDEMMMPDNMMPDEMMPDPMDGDNGDMQQMPDDNGDGQMMPAQKPHNPWASDESAPWNIASTATGGKKPKKQLTITFQLDRGY